MAESRIVLRQAELSDAAGMAQVDRASWPAALATDESGFRNRIDAYADGQWIAEADGRIVGVASAQRITDEFLTASGNFYDRITDCGRFTASHHPAGEIYQLVGVGVLPELRGEKLGRRLVDQQITWARSLPGVRRILGFTRPVRYHRHPGLSIYDYVRLRDESGRLVDPVLAFHVDAGAVIVDVYPAFRPDDQEAGGYGVLIEYPMH